MAEPFLITIGNRSINPNHMVSATFEPGGGGNVATLRVYLAGENRAMIFKGAAAETLWAEIATMSRLVVS